MRERKREVIKKRKHLSGTIRKPSVITRWDYTWLVMSSKCAKNLRQGNIKCEWCWRLTKGVGRWRRLVLLMPLFDPTLSFGYSVMLPTFTKQAPGIALIHSLWDSVYCHYLKWLPFSETMSKWAQPFSLDGCTADRGNMRPDNDQPENGMLCSNSLSSVLCDSGWDFCWHLIKPADRVIITSATETHLWGWAGLTVAPEPARVNKSSGKVVSLKGLQMAQCYCLCGWLGQS